MHAQRLVRLLHRRRMGHLMRHESIDRLGNLAVERGSWHYIVLSLINDTLLQELVMGHRHRFGICHCVASSWQVYAICLESHERFGRLTSLWNLIECFQRVNLPYRVSLELTGLEYVVTLRWRCAWRRSYGCIYVARVTVIAVKSCRFTELTKLFIGPKRLHLALRWDVVSLSLRL